MIAGPALLFCPADRPERYGKALAAADSVIIDLEDAVAGSAKPAARAALLANPVDPARTIVRVNAVGSAEFEADLDTLKQAGYRKVMLAKAETPQQLGRLEGYDVVALCETPLGIINAASIASAPNVEALMWGAEDLVAGLGGRSSRDTAGNYRGVAVQARASVQLAAGAYGKQAIDAVHIDIADTERLTAEAEDAAASGFAHKACIHPSQAAVVRDAFRPAQEEVDRAKRIVEAASGAGVLTVDGVMVDAPLVAQARVVLSRAR